MNKPKLLGWFLSMAFLISMMLSTSARMPMMLDEYTFYRLASQFPDYSSNTDWFYIDRPTILPDTAVVSKEWYTTALELQYQTNIFVHFPLPVIVMSPIVKGINALADAGVIPHIEDGYNKDKVEVMTFILRLIPMALFTLSMWLIFKMLWKRVGNYAYLFAAVPAATSLLLNGVFLFYWDVFMMFFFVLTLYIMETHPNSKWQYVTACCLVNTKIFIGLMFLAPLVLKNKKIIFAALSMIPFWVITWVVTGDPLYLGMHYLAQRGTHDYVYGVWLVNGLWKYMWNLGTPFFAVMTVPIVLFFRKYLFFVAFWFMASFYAWGSGLGLTHLSTMIYIGALIFPIIAYEFKLIDRVRGWLRPKEVELVNE